MVDQKIVVINGYCFCALDDLAARKAAWMTQCESLNLKGTVLLTPEGINIAMSGTRASIDALKDWVASDPLYGHIWLKETTADDFPFRRIRIKIKNEIISMASPEIDPLHSTAPNLPPKIFKEWLDEGKRMVLLDARNDYEVGFGTFKGAMHPHITGFKQYKEGMKDLSKQIDKDTTVVTFCTGGVRCEKSSSWMMSQGYKDVYQLEGGILNYFEEVGGEHFEGTCFVFDDRVALTTDGAETGLKQCECCRLPIEQAVPLHDAGKHGVWCMNCAEQSPYEAVQ